MSEPIAIVGMSCRFPGAPDKESYWRLLTSGGHAIIEAPASRWDATALYDRRPRKGLTTSKWGGFIDDIDLFDPEYFGFGAELAPQIDPLIRKLLEVSVECVADAGLSAAEVHGRRVAVIVGSRSGNYGQRIALPTRDTAIAVGQNFIAAHVAHVLDLRGPALVVDTACSSSLVSVHLACQSLRAGECDMALAGGVDLLLDHSPYLTLSEAKALSPDGRCFTFDVRANGFVPGEGAGMVLLKPLSRALADGDHVYAVIEGSAVNNDGRTMGVTTPNPEAQAEVIRSALGAARMSADTVSYLEAHGTGTMIGDPIELRALSRVFRESTEERQFCALGSVKSNIGHLMSAAGIASIIKTALCIDRRTRVPTLHCDTPNPRFSFAESPFYVGTQGEPWRPRNGALCAGISSFGFGGTNAHLVMADVQRVGRAYQPTRSPLEPIRFRRRRFWLEPTAVTPKAESTHHERSPVERGLVDDARSSSSAAKEPAAAPLARRPGLLELTFKTRDSSARPAQPSAQDRTLDAWTGEQ